MGRPSHNVLLGSRGGANGETKKVGRGCCMHCSCEGKGGFEGENRSRALTLYMYTQRVSSPSLAGITTTSFHYIRCVLLYHYCICRRFISAVAEGRAIEIEGETEKNMHAVNCKCFSRVLHTRVHPCQRAAACHKGDSANFHSTRCVKIVCVRT